MNSAPRSTFVTVTGWIFLVLSGFALLILLLDALMLQIMSSSGSFQEAMQSASAQQADMPAISLFLFKHLALFLILPLLAFGSTFVASLGLLRRWNWARVLFIVVMIIGIIWNLFGLAVQFFMMAWMRQDFAMLPPDAPDIGLFVTVMMAFSALFALAFCVLFGWIAKRLMAPAIVAEFKA